MSKKGVPVLTAAEFEAWLYKLLELYPQQVEVVALVGSRAFGYARPDSDWDVILCLEKDCYQEGEQIDKIEQRIAFDPDLRSEAIEIFFLRPDGGLGRWQFGPDEPPPLPEYVTVHRPKGNGEYEKIRRKFDPEADEGDDYIAHCILNGYPEGDFDRLRKSLKRAKVLYDRDEGLELSQGLSEAL